MTFFALDGTALRQDCPVFLYLAPINWVGCLFFAMALQEPLGLETLHSSIGRPSARSWA